MRCTERSRGTSVEEIRAEAVVRMGLRLGVCLLMVGIAAAQVPVVPTDHFGPPACGVQRGSTRQMTVAAARAEQESGAADGNTLLADEPLENFGIERYKLEDYADCVGGYGCYWADLDAQYERALKALTSEVAEIRAANHRGERLALVMDIDDTTLSSYCEMKAESFGYVGPMFNAWVVSPQAAVAIPGALRLFRAAKQDHVAVFFITGRQGIQMDPAKEAAADQTSATERNLKAAGFDGWEGLALRNRAEIQMDTIRYKSQERQKIAAMGYTIVMSVGDQWSDLLGDPKAAISVKLPNPFYFLP